MAVEYLYDCIYLTAGQDTGISATITDGNDEPITIGCSMVLYDENDEVIITVDGKYIAELGSWQFDFKAADTAALSGRYFYAILHDGESLCFKTPIYFE